METKSLEEQADLLHAVIFQISSRSLAESDETI